VQEEGNRLSFSFKNGKRCGTASFYLDKIKAGSTGFYILLI